MMKLIFTPTNEDAHTPAFDVSASTVAEVAAALLVELEHRFGISEYGSIAIFNALHEVVKKHEDGEPAEYQEFDFSMPEDAFKIQLVEV